MKTGRIFLIFSLLIVGIVIYFNKCKDEKKVGVAGTQKNQQPLIVNGIIASQIALEDKIYASGTLLANEEVEIRNEIPGRITALLFREGTKIKKGDLLITLFDDDLVAQLKKLQSQLEIATRNKDRQKDLLDINGISKQEYEISQNELTTIQADIDIVQSNLSKTKITAPFDGIIGLKTVSEGAFLPSNTRIVTIQSVDPLKLEFSVPERYRPLMSDSTSIQFTTESSEGIYKGRIYAFEPKIDLQTRSVIVRAICMNKDFKLYPGAFAHIEIPLKKIENAILVPTQALIPELKGQKIYVSRNGKAEKVAVETGMRNDSAIQITSGLLEGDTVLITGIMQMKPGMPLNITLKNHGIVKK